jgi:hypothetical protein
VRSKERRAGINSIQEMGEKVVFRDSGGGEVKKASLLSGHRRKSVIIFEQNRVIPLLYGVDNRRPPSSLFMEAPACSSETFLCTYKMADTT